MDDAVQALIIAFSAFVFVMALSLAVYMINQVTRTSEYLSYYSDTTRYYDNIDLENEKNKSIIEGNERYVSVETIVPLLYRYYKENFCVKIYDADDNLIQIFDMNLESKVHNIHGNNNLTATDESPTGIASYAYKMLYDNLESYNSSSDEKKNKKGYYLFGAPWVGSTEDIKSRIDLFINGEAGYINNAYVDYTGNKFSESLNALEEYKTSSGTVEGGNSDQMTELEKKFHYTEQFISYSYSGETFENEDGDVLTTGAESKDKIIIIYKLVTPEDNLNP